MPFDPAVTYERAEQSRREKLSIAQERRAPDPLGVIREASDRHKYHIFNVGPWPQMINTGSMGWIKVPGCPKNKEYVEASSYPSFRNGDGASVPGIAAELTIKDEFSYNELMTDGWKFAQAVLGIGRGQNPKQALTHYGLFPSRHDEPTPEEIFQAKTLLNATCSEIVREARDLYAMDRKAFSVVVKRNRHFAAAEVLNLNDEPWMIEQTPAQRKKCQYCQSMNDELAVLCAKCNHVIDLERYRELKAIEDTIMGREDKPRRGPGRPRLNPEE